MSTDAESPFTYARSARAYQAERAMLEALDRRDSATTTMLDRLLRAVGVQREAAAPAADPVTAR